MKPYIYIHLGPAYLPVVEKIAEGGKYRFIVDAPLMGEMMRRKGIPFVNVEGPKEDTLDQTLKSTLSNKLRDCLSVLNCRGFQEGFCFQGINFFQKIRPVLEGYIKRWFFYEIVIIEQLNNLFNKYNIVLALVWNDVQNYTKTLTLFAQQWGIPVLHLLHGIPVCSKNRPDSEFIYADRIVVYGDRCMEKYVSAGNPRDKIVVTGNPMWDIYRQWGNGMDKRSIRLRLGLPPERRIIMYASTLDTFLSARHVPGLVERSLNKVLDTMVRLERKRDDLYFIVKLHPSDKEGIPWYTERAKGSGVENIKVFQDRLQELLFVSDLVICHQSNVGIEAILMDRPVIVLNFDRYPDSLFYEGDAVISIEGNEDLEPVILKALFDDNTKMDLMENIRSSIYEFNYLNDGKASERVYDLIEEMIKKRSEKLEVRSEKSEDKGQKSGFRGQGSEAQSSTPHFPSKVRGKAQGPEPKAQSRSYYEKERPEIAALVPSDAKLILDVGCGAGILGKRLKEDFPERRVCGIEVNPEVAGIARANLDDVAVGDIEAIDLPFDTRFDCIIFADVLEHLKEPWSILSEYKKYLADDGCMIASIPNIGHWGVMANLLLGRWTYEDEGILDRTHLRFFTLDGIIRLFDDCGYKIDKLMSSVHPHNEIMDILSETAVKLGARKVIFLEQCRVFQYLIRAIPVDQGSGFRVQGSEDRERKTEGSTPHFPSKVRGKAQSVEKASACDNDRLKKARELKEMGDIESAIEEYKLLLERQPEDTELLKELGRIYFKKGEIKEALALGLKAEGIKAGEDDHGVLLLLGDCYCALGDYGRAEGYYKKAMESREDLAKPLIGLGTIYFQGGDYKTSLESFQRAIELDEGDDKAICGLGLVLWELGEREEAFSRYKEALDINIENRPALFALVRSSYEMNRFDETEEYLTRFLDVYPANIDILFSLAGILYEKKEVEKAKNPINKILLFSPDHEDAKALLKKIESEKKNEGKTKIRLS